MATIGDIKTGLNSAKTEAQKAITQVAAVSAQIDKSIAILTALTAGVRQPSVHKAIGNLQAAKSKLIDSTVAVQAAITDTDRYNAVL